MNFPPPSLTLSCLIFGPEKRLLHKNALNEVTNQNFWSDLKLCRPFDCNWCSKFKKKFSLSDFVWSVWGTTHMSLIFWEKVTFTKYSVNHNHWRSLWGAHHYPNLFKFILGCFTLKFETYSNSYLISLSSSLILFLENMDE